MIDETWIIVDSAGGGQTILFEILEGEYVNEAESDDCDDKLRDAKEKYLAKVIGFPCGQSSVYGMDANGNVEVQDYLGSFLEERRGRSTRQARCSSLNTARGRLRVYLGDYLD